VVAFAGPASNVVQAFFWSGLLSILLHAGVWSEQSAGVTILQFAIMINAVLFVLNMLPLPPLDGSRIVAAMLGPEARRGYLAIEPIGIFLLLALLFVDQFKLLLWMGVFTLGEWVAGLTRLPISWIPVFG
jgi:Zn-dependent protease